MEKQAFISSVAAHLILKLFQENRELLSVSSILLENVSDDVGGIREIKTKTLTRWRVADVPLQGGTH